MGESFLEATQLLQQINALGMFYQTNDSEEGIRILVCIIRTAHINIRQAGTSSEGISVGNLHTVQHHALQTATIHECASTNRLHSLRNRNGRQIHTISKSEMTDAGNSFVDLHAVNLVSIHIPRCEASLHTVVIHTTVAAELQQAILIKCPDDIVTCAAVCDHSAVILCTTARTDAIHKTVVLRIPFGDAAVKAGLRAVTGGIHPAMSLSAENGIADLILASAVIPSLRLIHSLPAFLSAAIADLGEHSTLTKYIATDRAQCHRDGDLLQISTALESTAVNPGQSMGQNNLREVIGPLEGMAINLFHAGRHGKGVSFPTGRIGDQCLAIHGIHDTIDRAERSIILIHPDLCQVVAILECAKTNLDHARRNGNAGERLAGLKRISLNVRHRTRDIDTSQLVTAGERRPADSQQALRQFDCRQVAAAYKCLGLD